MRGRKRKPNVVRDSSGKSRGEVNAIDPIVLLRRERELISEGVPLIFRKREMTQTGWREVEKRTAEDPLSGFTLGKLWLRGRANRNDPGGISQEQYEAGEEWAKIVRRHAGIMGYRLNVISPNMLGGGGGSAPPDAEVINRIREQYSLCFDALMAATRLKGPIVWRVTYGVAVENWPCIALSEADYDALDIGLMALVFQRAGKKTIQVEDSLAGYIKRKRAAKLRA